jgi:hypothetical protein
MLRIRESQERHTSLIAYEVVRFDPCKKNEDIQFSMCDPQDMKHFVTWITMSSCSSI